MDKFEFELRYRTYHGLKSKSGCALSRDHLFLLIEIDEKETLQKKITELSVDEIKIAVKKTYTSQKEKIYFEEKEKIFDGFPLGEYIDQIEYELKVVKEMGFNTYLLVVQDFINRAKHHQIAVGPGRGSAAGSLVCRLIGITDVNPLRYGLLFERFLNPARISMPDIDVDFEDTERETVVEYVKERYGKENVSHIGTFMKLAARAVFKDISRAMGIPFETSNAISNLIDPKKKLKDSFSENDELKNLIESDELYKKTFELAVKLENNYRQMGVHAAGVIIAPTAVSNFAPLQFPPTGRIKDLQEAGSYVTQYKDKVVEEIGLLKMDFLGLRNLSIIKNTIKIIYAKHQKEQKPLSEIFSHYFETMSFEPPLDDEKTFAIFQQGDTSGVFQFEGEGITAFLTKLKPTTMNDIVAMNALYRPGPMQFIPSYIARKHGEEEISYLSYDLRSLLEEKYSIDVADNEKKKLEEDFSPIMNETYGIAAYQEQLMKMVQHMAGFSVAEADLLRRAVGKKNREVIEKLKKEFIIRAEKSRAYKPETAQYVYEKMIEPAADYSFNKSHAVVYSLIAYQTAYLKAHYPLEFHAALMRSVEEDTERLSEVINEFQSKGLRILLPSLNHSYNHIAAVDDDIRLGFFSIKGVGSEVARSIQHEREQRGNFVSLEDFFTRCTSSITKKMLESFAKAGVLDQFCERNVILINIQYILDRIKAVQHQPASGGLFDIVMKPSLSLQPAPPLPLHEKLLMEYEVFKTFVSGHPFDGLYPYIKQRFSFINSFASVPNAGVFKAICIIRAIQRAKKKGFFITFEDISGSMEVFFKDILNLKKFDILIIEGFKGTNIRITKITKTSLDDLISEAKNQNAFDPAETVSVVKRKRMSR